MSDAPESSTSALKIRELHVSYGGVQALDGIDLDVAPGAFVSVLGANGAGKTTLVRAITGLLYLHKGRIRGGSIELDGASVVGRKSSHIVKSGVAQVPEGRQLFPNLSVEENLLCGAATRDDTDAIQTSLGEMYEFFPQLEKLKKQTAGLLSGGEQQMVAVGRALMSEPSLLICDELSLGLAPKIVSQLFGLLTDINKAKGMSVLVIEQNARLALQNSTSAYVLELGEVVLSGSSESLRENTMVQDLYLGGGGEAREAYASIKRPGRRPKTT